MGDVTHYAGDQCPGGHYEETTVSEAAKNSYLHFDGMAWPNPDDPALIEWRLRYGSPDEVRMVAASFVAAYKQLVADPVRRRNGKVAGIRAAAEAVRDYRGDDDE